MEWKVGSVPFSASCLERMKANSRDDVVQFYYEVGTTIISKFIAGFKVCGP